MAAAPRPPPQARIADVISNFQPTRKFAPTSGQKPYSVTSIDFDDTGELALVAQDDETLQIYNCKEGKHAKELKSQKYGVDLARFAHHPQSIIYASTKGDDAIRYLSSHDNSYIRYFRGHTGAVTCITLNPASDEFMSASLDNTVRLWDLRSQSPQGQLNLYMPHICAYDPTATVIAIASPVAQSILLYDSRNYDKAPFATFDLSTVEKTFAKANPIATTPTSGASGGKAHTPGDWTCLSFSNDGKSLLVGTTGPGHYLLDAFDGDLRAYLARPSGGTNRIPPNELGELRARQQSGRVKAGAPGVNVSGQGDVCLSPDGAYAIGGSGEAGLYVWDPVNGEYGRGVLGTGATIAAGGDPALLEKALRPSYELSNKAAGTASIVAYNPRHNLLATADRALVLWLPDMES